MTTLAEAVRLHAAGRLAEAERAYRSVLGREPGNAAAMNNLGNLLLDTGRAVEAVPLYRAVLAAMPDHPGVMANLGIGLRRCGAIGEALALLGRAAARAPDDALVLGNLGEALIAAGRPDAALGVLDAVLARHPDDVEALVNRGVALREVGRLHAALASLDAALLRRPDLAAAHDDRGTVLKDLGRIEEALEAHARAHALAPDDPRAHGNLAFALHYDARASGEAILAEHRRFDALHGRTPWPRSPAAGATEAGGRPLRIGFLSPDLRDHPVGRFLEPVLEALDPARWTTVAFALSPQMDAVAERLRARCAQWVDCHGLDDTAIVGRIHAHGIDVLVDLAGHSADNRLTVFAGRAAPLQVAWLGYPGTTGLAAMDLRITDAEADPPGAEAHHSETLVRLEGGFLCWRPPAEVPVAPLPMHTRGHPTFGSFNHSAKVGRACVALWSEVLAAVPEARLLLKFGAARDPDLAAALGARFAAHGIDPARIDVRAPVAGAAEHLAAYADVDVALDTFPYAGTTTTCDALWMGVPVVTLAGDRHAARMGASLLSRVGLASCIARHDEEYVARARALVADVDALAALRAELRPRMERSTLMDAHGLAARLDEALRAAWNERRLQS